MTQLSFKQTLGALSFIRMSGVMRRGVYSLATGARLTTRVPDAVKRGSAP